MRGEFTLQLRSVRAVSLVVLLVLSVLTSLAAHDQPVTLTQDEPVQAVRANQQTYELYLDAPAVSYTHLTLPTILRV